MCPLLPPPCSKAPIQAFADRVSAVFVPIVAVLALLTWLLWYLAGSLQWYPQSWLPQASRGWVGQVFNWCCVGVVCMATRLPA